MVALRHVQCDVVNVVVVLCEEEPESEEVILALVGSDEIENLLPRLDCAAGMELERSGCWIGRFFELLKKEGGGMMVGQGEENDRTNPLTL